MEDYYGDFYRAIFECLTGGRYNAQQVAQKCHLPLRQARAGIAGLLQLRLVHHHTARDALPLYSANIANAYDIIRTGRLINAAQVQHGEDAAKVIATICGLGFCTVAELRDRLVAERSLPEQSAHNITKIIDDLLETHYLIYLRKAHFGEPHDVRREEELKVLSPAAIAKLTGSKAKLEHAMRVDIAYDQVVDTRVAEYGHINPSFVGTQQNGHTTNGIMANGNTSDPATIIQPNFYKVVGLSQQNVVAEHARRMHGKKASTIIQSAVEQSLFSDQWSKSGHRSIHDIHTYRLLDDSNSRHRKGDTMTAEKPNGITNGNHSDDSEITMDDIEAELLHMTEGPFQFLSNMATSTFQIDKEALDNWVRKEETLRVMDSRLDPPAPRILRILIDKGKLEEKTLQEIGLLGAKELRQSLSTLKQMGYLDLQDVPRNPTRLPNQTVFLWSYEPARVASLVLEQVFTAMVRMLQFLSLERTKIAGTLKKLEREDVKGREEEALPGGELTVLSRFRKTESWVWAELHRLDATVAILRDT